MWNVTVERQLSPSWFVSAGYVGSRTNNIWESTPLNNGRFPERQRRAAERGQHERAPSAYARGSRQRASTTGRSISMSPTASSTTTACCCRSRTSGAHGTSLNANYTLVALLRIAGRLRRQHHQRVVRLQHPGQSRLRRRQLHGGSSAELHDDAAAPSPRFDDAGLQAVASGWRLVGSFRALTGPWLTITTGADVALNGQAGTQRANQVSSIDLYANQSVNPANGGIRFLNPAAFAQPADRHAWQHASQHRPRAGQQEPRSGADARLPVLERAEHRGSRRGVQRVQLVRAGDSRTPAINAATFGQITSTSTTVRRASCSWRVKYAF